MSDQAAHDPGPPPAWGTVGAAARELPPVAPVVEPLGADVCVIGLGASGLTAALHLADRGADVVAVDAHGIAAAAAGRNGGFLLAGLAHFHHDAVAAYGRDRAVALYRWTLDELERTLEWLPEPVARRVGSLRIAADAEERRDCRRMLAQLQADGLPAEDYDGPEGVGVLLPTDAAMDPRARCAVLAERAVAAGVRLHAPFRVAELRPGTVHGVEGEVRADRVIVAVDGGLDRVVPELAGRVDSVRLQMLATAPDHGVDLPRPVYRRWGYDYVQQLPTGEVLLGGFRDRGVDEVGAPPLPSAVVQDHLDTELRRLGVTAPVTHRWAARAGFTADKLPICAELRPGVFVIGGYSGHGNVIGTACGRLAADAALDGTPLRLPA
ncbi:NAD(P)/FAD-dependent oxidoreductase [Egicoccus sp. AB-alg6-2]|uniref:NAD(P)/FAD-dependent oxidoreductase n=1 Tax=Egicoccus sp. AB-alg6-2 TaxID=3242692 RepID=UPI00359E38AF